LIGFFYGFIFSSLPAFAGFLNDQIQVIDPNEIQFEEGMKLLDQGHYDDASIVFGDLYDTTLSPRVKLEWARSLYLSGKKEEAGKLFREVLERDPPMMVRERVNVFLADIDNSKGRADISVGVIYDTNPRAVTNDRVVNLFGFSFNYDPGSSTKPQTGLGYSINAAKALDSDNKWLASFTANGAQFSDIIFNRTTLEESLTYRLYNSPNLQLKLAYEEFIYGGRLLYTDPSISLKHAANYDNGSYWTNEIKFAEIHYPSIYYYLNGPLYTALTSYGRPIFDNIVLGFDLGLDRAAAKESPYSYYTKTLGLNSNFLFPDCFIKGQIKALVAERNYDDPDPIFGIIRKDIRHGFYFSVVKTDWKLFDMTPTLDVSYEKNNSDVNIYKYDREVLTISFKKTF